MKNLTLGQQYQERFRNEQSGDLEIPSLNHAIDKMVFDTNFKRDLTTMFDNVIVNIYNDLVYTNKQGRVLNTLLNANGQMARIEENQGIYTGARKTPTFEDYIKMIDLIDEENKKSNYDGFKWLGDFIEDYNKKERIFEEYESFKVCYYGVLNRISFYYSNVDFNCDEKFEVSFCIDLDKENNRIANTNESDTLENFPYLTITPKSKEEESKFSDILYRLFNTIKYQLIYNMEVL